MAVERPRMRVLQRKPLKPPSIPIGSGPMMIALASIRNTEAYLRWQGAQWIIAANLSGLTAILYVLLQIPEPTELALLAAGCAGATGFDLQWYHVLRRDGRLFDFWNQKLAEHERANGIDGGIEIFTSREYQRLSSSPLRLQDRLEKLCILFIVGWGILVVTLPILGAMRGLGAP